MDGGGRGERQKAEGRMQKEANVLLDCGTPQERGAALLVVSKQALRPTTTGIWDEVSGFLGELS